MLYIGCIFEMITARCLVSVCCEGLSDGEAQLIEANVVVSAAPRRSHLEFVGSAGVASTMEALLRLHRTDGDVLVFVLNAVNSLALSESGREVLWKMSVFPLVVEIYQNTVHHRETAGAPQDRRRHVLLAALNVVVGTLCFPFLNRQSDGKKAASSLSVALPVDLDVSCSSDSSDANPSWSEMAARDGATTSSSESANTTWDSSGACEVLVFSMGECLQSSDRGSQPLLCETLLRAMHYLVQDSRGNQTLCGSAGACGLVVAMLRLLIDSNASVVFHAVQCIGSLAGSNHRENAVELGRHGVCDLVCRALATYSDIEEVAESCCRAIHALRQLNHSLGQAGACGLVLETFARHSNDGAVAQWVGVVLI